MNPIKFFDFKDLYVGIDFQLVFNYKSKKNFNLYYFQLNKKNIYLLFEFSDINWPQNSNCKV